MRLGGRRPNLDKLRRDGDVDGLREAAAFRDVLVVRNGELIDRGVPTRVAALEALSEHCGEEVQPTLAAGLEDDAPRVRRAAVAALGKDGSPEAIGALVDFLATEVAAEDPEACRAALTHVTASTQPGHVERWARRVRDSRNGTLGDADRQTFATLLAADDTTEAQQRVFDVLAPTIASDSSAAGDSTWETVLRWCAPTRFDGLAPMLARDRVPVALVRLAGLTGDQALLDPLADLLERPDPDVRREAAQALGALCDTRAVLPLLRATSDPELSVRQAAIAAFDSLGGAGVTAAMSLVVREANRQLETPAPERPAALEQSTDPTVAQRSGIATPGARDAPAASPRPARPLLRRPRWLRSGRR